MELSGSFRSSCYGSMFLGRSFFSGRKWLTSFSNTAPVITARSVLLFLLIRRRDLPWLGPYRGANRFRSRFGRDPRLRPRADIGPRLCLSRMVLSVFQLRL